MSEPTHGYTAAGAPVHAKTIDHHPDSSAYQRFNKKVALILTNVVGTMTCFWVFCVIALCSLPAVLALVVHSLSHVFPSWLIAASLVSLVAWISSNFIQLVLLPALMVGQNLQNEAADARTAKQVEDLNFVRDQIDIHTDGGLKLVIDRIDALQADLTSTK